MFPAAPGRAHEFWIAPLSYQVPSGEAIVADLRVGEFFRGPAYSYFPPNFTRFEVAMGDMTYPVAGRMGDRPALTMAVPGDGLAILVHETTDRTLTWDAWNKFESFVRHKGFSGVLEKHKARGLPNTGFTESYRRYAKALVVVGDGGGSDRRMGLETEIVAGANPYRDDLSDGFPVQVFYQGVPRAGALLTIFEKSPDGAVETRTMQLDAKGRARVAVRSGSSYLLDAVVLQSTGNDDATAGPVWHSLWAALTFAVP